MEAIILAGGFGTRLQSIVKNIPKPMADINGQPFLTYIFDFLVKYKISKVILSVGYKKEIIEKYFKNKYKNISILYSKEDEPLGTGGAIKKALSMCTESDVLVLNGDTFFEVDLKKILNQHIDLDADITLSLKKMYEFDRYGKVIVEKNCIVGFGEKEFSQEGLINGGVYVIKNRILDHMDMKFSFEQDFLEKEINSINICYYESKGYFIDIGIPEDYKKAIYDFNDKKALFLDRDGIVNIDYGHVYKKEEFEFSPDIFKLCKYFKKKDYLIIIVTNQAGIAKGYYTEEEFKTLSDWMLGEFNKVDINILEIFYCPHHPTDGNGKYLQKCQCRKPAPKMLLDAQNKYAISLKKSIFIGDKISDIQAGERAGIGELILIQSKYQDSYDFKSLKEYIELKEKN